MKKFIILYVIFLDNVVSLACLYYKNYENFMEEIIFLQMCLMKENMKIVQDRLLQEMASQLTVVQVG